MALVQLSTAYYPDPEKNRALFNTDIYVGQPGLDPSIPANQKQLKVRVPNSMSPGGYDDINVGQPQKTNSAGLVIYNGSPVPLVVDGRYSILAVRDDDTEFYEPNNEGLFELKDITGDMNGQPVDDMNDYIDGQKWEFESIFDFIAATPNANVQTIRSYSGGYDATANGPEGGHKRYRTGGTNAAPTKGTPVSVSTIGGVGSGAAPYTGQIAQAGLCWDAAGVEWRYLVEGQSINVLAFGMDRTGATNVVKILEDVTEFSRSAISGLPQPVAGSPASKYVDIYFPAGKYLYTETFFPPGNTFTRYVGTGDAYFASEFVQGFNGNLWESQLQQNLTFTLEKIVFQGNPTFNAGMWTGLKLNATAPATDAVHMNVIGCVFRDFWGYGADLNNVFSCCFTKNIYGWNREGGLRVIGGSNNSFLCETTQVNEGAGMEIGGNNVTLTTFLEADLIRNNPAGENANFKALKFNCTNSECVAVVNTDDLNDKTPVEISNRANKVRLVAVDKGVAVNWVEFGASAFYNECHGGAFNMATITGDNAAIKTSIFYNDGQGPGIRTEYDKALDKGSITCSEIGVANKDLDVNAANINLTATNVIINGNFASDMTATATSVAALNRVLPVYNQAGGLLGYIPISPTFTP